MHIYSSAILTESYQEAKGKNRHKKKSIITSPASVIFMLALVAIVLVLRS